MENNYKYTFFLESDDFILWQLYKSAEYESYWADFIHKHPDAQSEMDKAISIFSKIKVSKFNLSTQDRDELFNSINISVARERRKLHRLRLFYATVSAAAAILIIVSAYLFQWQSTTQVDEIDFDLFAVNYSSTNIQLINSEQLIELEAIDLIRFDMNGCVTISVNEDQYHYQLSKESTNKLIVPYGHTTTLILPDNSKLWINAGSEVHFPSSFNKKSRDITIKGEIYAEVFTDRLKPFCINSPSLAVEVTGTQFNISDYEDNTTSSVVLVEGMVRVGSIGSSLVSLSPSEMYCLSQNSHSVTTVDVREFTSWKDGYIYANRMSVKKLMKLVSRHYNISFENIENSAIQNKSCSGKFVFDKDVDLTIQSISNLTQMKFKRENQNIYLIKQTR